jgi:hypothetical protein
VLTVVCPAAETGGELGDCHTFSEFDHARLFDQVTDFVLSFLAHHTHTHNHTSATFHVSIAARTHLAAASTSQFSASMLRRRGRLLAVVVLFAASATGALRQPCCSHAK